MKVITTVGTSLFDNYQKTTGNNLRYYNLFKNREYYCELYKGKEYSQKEELLKKIECIRNDSKLQEWISNNPDTCCAEISSLRKILNEPSLKKEKIAEVRLLATQTTLSRLAAEIIRDKFSKVIKGVEIKFYPDADDVIDGLSLASAGDFEEKGLPSLVARLNDLGINNANIIVNITGGYKGVIPFLTILGQINKKSKIMYLYEDSDEIITIPRIPISYDWSVMEEACLYLNEEYLNYGEENDAVIHYLQENNLIERKGECLKITAVGNIVKESVKNRTPYGRVLGDIVELKLLKYFTDHHVDGFDKVLHSVKKLRINGADYDLKVNDLDYGDLDIVLIDEAAERFLCVEAKSFAQLEGVIDGFLSDNERNTIHKKLCFFRKFNVWPEKFILLIHRMDISDMNLFKESLRCCKKKFETQEGIKTEFEVMSVKIPIDKINPYASFVRNDLLLETIDLD